MSSASPVPGDQYETDSALIHAVRAGDMDAASTLYARHYAAALRAARGIGGQGIAEDLVAEAFTKVLASLIRGHGPDHALRPYLVTTIRNLYVDGIRRNAREFPVGDSEVLDGVQPDDSEALLEHSLMLEVLTTLPPRWREILWRTIVVGEPLSVVAATMGLKPNAAAALSFRARGGLGKAYRDRVNAAGEPRDASAGGASVQGA
jgi:RNA polymerase sigma factor (sigma-70 family)